MVVGVFIGCENTFRKKAEYIFNQFFSVLGILYQILSDMHDVDEKVHQLIISYGKYIQDYPNKCIINIFHRDTNERNNEWYHQLYESQPPEVSYIFTRNNDKIPYLYPYVSFDQSIGRTLYEYADANDKSNVAVQSIEIESGLIINVGFDLVKSAFFLLSREEEELMCNEHDLYNRFSARLSVAHKNDFIHIPVIDEYIKIINELIFFGFEKIKMPLIQKCPWPQNKDFAVCLTHDVDRIKKWTVRRILSQFVSSGMSLFKLEIKQSVNKLTSAIKSVLKDPYWTFEEILIAEEKYGFKSSFYFCANGNHELDPKYNVNSKKIMRLISDIYKKGCEVGLHGSFDSYNDYELLSKEKRVMEKSTGIEINGIRQHYLRFKYPNTWRLQEKIGFKYDTTLGYADKLGFRAGTAFPFYPFDLQKNRVINVLEIQLTIMDATFKWYLKVTSKDAFIQIKKLLETVEKTRGVAVLLWHTNVFGNEDNPGWGEVYYKILEYLAGQNAWVTSCKEITDWWIARESLKVVEISFDGATMKLTYTAEEDIRDIYLRINTFNRNCRVSVDGIDHYKVKSASEMIYLEMNHIIAGSFFTINIDFSENRPNSCRGYVNEHPFC